MKRLLLITLFSLALGCLLAGCDDASNPDALSQSTPQTTATPQPTPTHDPSVMPSYEEVEAILVGGDTEAYTLIGTRLLNWHGWVVWKSGTSVYVHIEDPFAEELLPDLTWDEWSSRNPEEARRACQQANARP